MSLDAILEIAERFENAIEQRHLIGGLILPTVVLPPQGREDFQTGNYENCAIWTGLYVAAQSLKYAATKDPKARAKAKRGVLALNKLQDVTREPGSESGSVARGFKLRDESTWDELFFWIKEGKNLGQSKLRDNKDYSNGDNTKVYDVIFGFRRNNEWHQKEVYRWLGDASKSQIFGVLFGYFAFHHFCYPTAEEKKITQQYVGSIVHNLLDKKMRVVDKDGKTTSYGNYGTHLGYGIGPAITLSEIKLAHHITEEERFKAEYTRQLEKAKMAGSITPRRLDFGPLKYTHTNLGSDDSLVMLNCYMLMCLEQNPDLLSILRKGLEERWHAINDHENSLFNFIYHALLGEESVVLQQGTNALLEFPTNKIVNAVALKRELSKGQQLRDILAPAKIPIQERPVDEYIWRVNPFRHDKWVAALPGKMEFTGIDFLIAAYLGMYHGFIR